MRKTYITKAKRAMGQNAHIVSNHEGMEIMDKHYIDEEVILKAAAKKMKFLGTDRK